MRSVPGSPTFFERSFDRPRGSARPFAFQTLAMKRSLLIALISTDYPPLRTSAAVQLRDLAQQLAALGHRPIVIVPSPMSGTAWMVERIDGIEVLRVAAPPTRSPSFVRRAIAEMWLPFAMFLNIRRSSFASAKWDVLVWYSPPIFFGPLIAALRRKSRARTYLILRDIFPEWAVDLGLVRRGPVYVGNMGIAQGMDIFIDLVQSLRERDDIGFLFVGRGSEFARLEAEKVSRELNNALFFGEIDSSEVPGLLAQCHVGLVALHPDHKTHNIPGKFVSYVQYGVPVLARVNAGTDLQRQIEDEQVGKVYVGNSVSELKRMAEQLDDDEGLRNTMSERGRKLGRSMFSPDAAARQIVASATVPSDGALE